MRSKNFMAYLLLLSLLVVSTPSTSYCFSWKNNLSDSLEKSRSEGKPVMVDFYADWCGWCKKLDRDTYSNPKVQDLAQRFICVKVNGDKFPNFVSKYLIEGYPTIVFLDPGGKEITRIAGYTDANGLSAKMERIAAKYPGAGMEKAQPKKTASSGWKANIEDLWNKVAGVDSKKEEASRSSASSVQAAPRSGTEISPAGANTIVYSDLIIMNNGNSVQGMIKEEKSDLYLIKLPFGEVKLKKSDVKDIKRLPPEEACLNMGNKFLESHSFGSAITEYNKALKINPEYLPAKDAISAAKKKKLEYESRLKASIEQGEKAREKEKLAETSTINEKSTVKQIPYFISIRDMNIPLKKSYRFYDFGFTVDNNLVINGFVYPDVFPGKDRVKTINSSPAEYAGVRLGDRIVSVNGRSVSGLSPIDVEKIIGSIRYIKLVVERQ